MRVSRFSVRELWGVKDFDLNFNKNVNFLIGENGTGKTALVNLLASTLQGDLSALHKLHFKDVTVVLSDGEKSEVSILVTKGEPSPFFPTVEYLVKRGDEELLKFSLGDFEDEGIVKMLSSRSLQIKQGPAKKNLNTLLDELVNISWLSIHRTAPSISKEERSYESTVDKKLDQQLRDMGRFLSALDSLDKFETEMFQKSMFLSLIPIAHDEAIKGLTPKELKHDKEAFQQILKSFKVNLSDYGVLDKFFELAEKGRNAKAYSTEELAALFGVKRVHTVVTEWQKLLEKRAKIYRPRESYLAVVNSLLREKTIEITAKNEAVAKLRHTGKTVPLNELSSGEKQLLIILGEALLNQQEDWIYIADEPELSLHVNWQSALVESVLKINGKVQLIFATHSPDIVSRYSSRVIEIGSR